MRLLIDENVPTSVARFFEERDHEVVYVRDVLPAGMPDPVVAMSAHDCADPGKWRENVVNARRAPFR
jgi:predicted nuclease of predicted toxin-antitoxin system